jgi:molybdate transport system substrate-binding protein
MSLSKYPIERVAIPPELDAPMCNHAQAERDYTVHRTLRLVAIAATAALTVSLSACSSSGSDGAASTAAAATTASDTSTASSGPSTIPVTGTVVVLAASSLTGAFNTLKAQFEAANPGAKIEVSYGASSALAAQITSGAPADVFASASPSNMMQVVTAGGANASTNFVKNVMEIAVPPDNPKGITGVADLAKSGVKVALCQPQVPCGSVAAKIFVNAKVTVKAATLQPDVKSTLTVVESKEVDAGVVYVTDVMAAGDKVKGIVIPDDVNASTEYPIAALTKAANAAGAAAFVAYVLSPAGQAALTAAGFEKP